MHGIEFKFVCNLVFFHIIRNWYHKSQVQISRCRFRAEKLPVFGHVGGITCSNEELYVIVLGSPGIDVYDIGTLAQRRKITVQGLVDAFDIVAHENVLYVWEYGKQRIYRIELADETSSHWFVNSECLTMSINKKGNILASCLNLDKIIEYTPIGSCVREIKVNAIDETIIGVRHAIQLDDDRFLICHISIQHRVCIIDSNGRMLKCYGGESGSGIGQMDFPIYLAIDRNGFILVVDLENNRVIQLNASLEFVREFIPGSVGLKKPRRMHLQEDMKRLYIGEYDEPNIAIFDL